MSVQALLDLNDVPDIAHEPGPGHYFGPGSPGFSSLGRQKVAKAPSAPEISLPKTGWDNWNRVVVSRAHSVAYRGMDSPTAKYQVPSTLDTKAPKIGTSLRPDLALSLGVDPHGSPGPAYNLRDMPGAMMGEGSIPEKRENKSFGLAQRFPTDMRNANVGPGQYARKDVALNAGTGKSIGTGRHSWEKVITPGWECEGRCRASPGPGPPLWHDFQDLKKANRAVSIPKAERFPRARSEGPGPGAYDQSHKTVSSSKQVTSDASSPCTRSFGNLPKKPRFRPLLAQIVAKRGAWGYL